MRGFLFFRRLAESTRVVPNAFTAALIAFNCRSKLVFVFSSFRASFCNAASSFIQTLRRHPTLISPKRKAEGLFPWLLSALIEHLLELAAIPYGSNSKLPELNKDLVKRGTANRKSGVNAGALGHGGTPWLAVGGLAEKVLSYQSLCALAIRRRDWITSKSDFRKLATTQTPRMAMPSHAKSTVA